LPKFEQIKNNIDTINKKIGIIVHNDSVRNVKSEDVNFFLKKKKTFSIIKKQYRRLGSTFQDLREYAMKLLVDDLNKNLEKQLHFTTSNMDFLLEDYDNNSSNKSARERKRKEDILLQDINRDNAEKELHDLEKNIHLLENLTAELTTSINKQEKDLCRIQSLLDEPRVNLEINSNCKLIYSSPATINTMQEQHDHTISYAMFCAIVSILLFITMIFLKYFYKPLN
jgi:hypothetical protein